MGITTATCSNSSILQGRQQRAVGRLFKDNRYFSKGSQFWVSVNINVGQEELQNECSLLVLRFGQS
jgi:hypothetical protein